MTNCLQYRSISLINADGEIFVSMLAGKLGSTLARYMHLDQLGIIIGRLFADTIMRALGLLCKKHKTWLFCFFLMQNIYLIWIQ